MSLIPSTGLQMSPVNPQMQLIAHDRQAQMDNQLAVHSNNNMHQTSQGAIAELGSAFKQLMKGSDNTAATNNQWFNNNNQAVIPQTQFSEPNMSMIVPNNGHQGQSNQQIQPARQMEPQPREQMEIQPAAQTPEPTPEQIPEPAPVPQKTMARPTGTVNIGSRTKKSKRKGQWKAETGLDIKLNSDFLQSLKPCKDPVNHENCLCDWTSFYFDPIEFIEARGDIIDHLGYYGCDLTDGGVCMILNQDDSIITDDPNILNMVHYLREDRGMNKRYGEKSYSGQCFEKPMFGKCSELTTDTCNDERHLHCACYQYYLNRGHCVQCFKNWYNKVSFNLSTWFINESMSKRLKKVANAQQRKNIFARQLQWIDDYGFLQCRKHTMAKFGESEMIEVRKVLGLKSQQPKWVAEADEEEIPCVDETWFGNIKNSVVNVSKMTYETFKTWILKVVDSAISFCSGSVFALKSFLITIKDKFLNYFFNSIFGKIFAAIKEKLTKPILAGLIALIALVTMSAIGFIKWNFLMPIFGITKDCALGAIDCVLRVLSKIFSLSFKDVKGWCTNLIIISAGLGAALTLSQKAFALLPFAIRSCLIHAFGTTEQKDKLKIDNWKARALTLLAVRRVPRVVCSDFYSEKLKEINTEGFELLKTLEPNRRLEILTVYNNISKAWQDYIQKVEAEKPRNIPFCVHLAGPAGVGKTTFHTKLMAKLGYTGKDRFSRPPGSEYWDGFIGSKVVVYDEFLINPDLSTNMATEFLSLCSSSPFRPPLASIDNIAVGMKGTAAAPELVITINNATHYSPPSMQERMALLRRRNAVIEFKLDADFLATRGIIVTPETKNVDMLKLFPLDIQDSRWFVARLHDPTTNQKPSPWMSARGALSTIEKMAQRHALMNSILNIDEREDLSPEEYFKETMKLHYNIPKDEISWTNFLTGSVSKWLGFSAEGKKKTNEYSALIVRKNSTTSESSDDYCEPSLHLPSTGSDWLTDDSTSVNSDYISRDVAMINTPDEPLPGYFEYIASFATDYVMKLKTHAGIGYFAFSSKLKGHLPEVFGRDPTMYLFCGFLALLSWTAYKKYSHRTSLNFFSDKNFFEGESAAALKVTRSSRERKLVRGSKWHAEAASNLYGTITIPQVNSDYCYTFYFVNLGKRYILTTAHGFSGLTGIIDIAIKVGPTVVRFKKNVEDIVFDSVNDFAVMMVEDCSFPSTKLHLNRFATHDEMSVVGELQVKYKNDSEDRLLTTKITDGWNYSTEHAMMNPSKMWRYFMKTKNGYCGTPIISVDNMLPGKIVGIHCAGNKDYGRGGATLVTREDLVECISILNPNDPALGESVGQALCFKKQPEQNMDFPPTNIVKEERVSFDERIHFPTGTKIKKSLLNGFLVEQSVKEPSIMHAGDPRSEFSPDQSYLNRIEQLNKSIVDKSVLKAIKETMISNYKINIDKKLQCHRLSIEHAIGGIAGYLASLRVKTSPGFPVAIFTRNGKKECFSFGLDGKLKIETWFHEMVNRRLKEMEQGYEPNNRFVVFFKDELVSPEKIKNARTRAIYCNDVVSLVAFRMVFGSTLARLNNSHSNTPLSIGINQYSIDMHQVYNYLTQVGNKFVAGDYKDYDSRYSQVFQRAAYEIFFALNENASTPTENEYLWKHEAQQNKLQFKDKLITLHTIHTSGCFLTSVINCFVNELYFRYNFAKRFPDLSFDKNIRMKVLGDDHILCISNSVDYNSLMIKEDMEKIGQIYTSDIKDQELTAEYRKFSEISFLGAIPRTINYDGYLTWVGAPKKSQLWQTPQWTRTNNSDLDQTIESHVYLSALWDKEFHSLYVLSLKDAYTKSRTWEFIFPSHLEMQRIAASRSSSSNLDWFRSESGWVAEAKVGLTQLADESISETNAMIQAPLPMDNHGIQESYGKIDFGTDSLIFRDQFDWKVSDADSTEIYQMELPFGALIKGQPDNLQNMPFERYLYVHHDFEVVLQIAGTPFHQGALICILDPLGTTTSVRLPSGYIMGNTIPSWTFFNHVVLSPNTSTTATLKAPFFYHRDWLNTRSRQWKSYQTFPRETPYTLRVGVLSRLLTGEGANTTIPISVYTRFPNLKVAIPKPVGDATARTIINSFTRTPAIILEHPEFEEGQWEAEGNSISTTNSYSIENVVGNVPIGTSNQESATQTVSPNTQMNPNISALPMDNPPLMSGSIPTYNAYPSRSKIVGTSTGVSLSHHPEEMHRLAHEMGALNAETSIEHYCSRPTLLGKVLWKPNDLPGSKMLSVPLNSVLTFSEDLNIGKAHWIPSCCFPLNLAQYWRADFKFTMVAVMSDFHSGRLRATIAYGSPYMVRDNLSVFRNEILDFTSGSEVASIIVPYNAPTEYLSSLSEVGRTPSEIKIMNTTIGLFELSVANQLMAPISVAQTVEVLVFVSASNVKLRELRSVCPIRPSFNVTLTQFQGWEAEANVTGVVEKSEERVDDFTNSKPIPVNDSRSFKKRGPCKLDIGRKFEYTISDLTEMMRRYIPCATRLIKVGFNEAQKINLYTLRPMFPTVYREAFTAWAGHLQFRFIVVTTETSLVTISLNYTPPEDTIANEDCIAQLTEDQIQFTPSGSELPSKRVTTYRPNPEDAATLIPVEDLFPVSNNVHYIDVRMPFNTNLNFLPISGDYYRMNNLPASFAVNVQGGDIKKISVSLKASDDLRLYIARPVCNFQVYKGAEENSNFAGFRNTDLSLHQ